MKAPPVWNEEQLAFIQAPFDSHGRLLGIPGAGKTSVILQRCEHWKRELHLQPANYLILMFSNEARHNFLTRAKAMNYKGYTQANVRTVHSLAGGVLHKLRQTSSMETCVATAHKHVTPALLALLPYTQHVRNLIVDEAQDVSVAQYSFIMRVADMLGAVVTMVGDPDQAIYGFQGGDNSYLMKHPGYSIAFTRNYRCSPAIVNVLNCIRNPALPAMVASSVCHAFTPSPTPILVNAANFQELAASLLSTVGRSYSTQVVAVLGPVRNAKPSPFGAYFNIGLQWAAQVLRDAGVPVQLHYREGAQLQAGSRAGSGPPGTNGGAGGGVGGAVGPGVAGVAGGAGGADAVEAAVEKRMEPGVVHLLTLHGAKGLEFDTVLLLNYHADTMGAMPRSNKQFTELQNLWRVGMSRARRRLVLLALQEKRVWFDYQRIEAHVTVQGTLPRVTAWAAKGEVSGAARETPYEWVKDVMQNRELVPEQVLAEVECSAALSMQQQDPLFDPAPAATQLLPEWETYQGVYQLWADNLFFSALTHLLPPVFGTVQVMVDNRLTVRVELRGAITKLQQHCNSSQSGRLPLAALDVFTARHPPAAGTGTGTGTGTMLELLGLIDQWRLAHPGAVEVFVTTPNRLQHYDEPECVSLIAQVAAAGVPISSAHLWQLCLFMWQHDAEAGYRWQLDFGQHVRALHACRVQVEGAAQQLELECGAEWQVSTQALCGWPEVLRLVSTVDVVLRHVSGGEARVVSLKFTPARVTLMDCLHAWGGAVMLDASQLQVWNLMSGERCEARIHHGAQARSDVACVLKPCFDGVT